MMECASQQAGPRSHTIQGETRAASTLSVPPGRNMSPPVTCLLFMCVLQPTEVTWVTGAMLTKEAASEHSPGTKFHRKDSKEF